MLAREERHDPFAWHVGAEVRDQVPEVVFLGCADRAVGQEHVRAALREPADGVVGVDPGVHPLGPRQFRQRRTQFRSDHPAGAEQRIEKRWNRRGREHQPFSLAPRIATLTAASLYVDYSYRMPRLTFLGAAQTVTGSKYLLDTNGTRLLVDCGLFQGLKSLRERNWTDPPVDPASIHAVVLTHAHLDHTGFLPRLVAKGFRGRIFCTPGTADLCRLVLPDAARLQEEDAREANRHGYSKHAPALPLFTESDAFRALSQLQPVGFHRPVPAAAGVEISFSPTGHLLGAAAVTMVLESGKRIVFGGDLGPVRSPRAARPGAGCRGGCPAAGIHLRRPEA